MISLMLSMWTSQALWDLCKLLNLSIISLSRLASQIITKEFEIIEIGVEEGVDLGSAITDSLLPNVVF
jgi:hypothetical protein